MKTYEKYIGEAVQPYSGTHINHTSHISHVQNVMSTKYKVIFSPSISVWYVMGTLANGNWVPVTNGFAEKSMAQDYLVKLNKANASQKKMIGTI